MTSKIKAQREWPFFQAYHDCHYIVRHNCDREIVLRETGEPQTYRLHNKSGQEIVVYRIDGGLIADPNVLKCDYGLYTEQNSLYLVELKGANLNHALEQITGTIVRLLKTPDIKVNKLNVRIVLSKVSIPRIPPASEHRLMRLLHKSYGGGDYRKQSQFLEEDL